MALGSTLTVGPEGQAVAARTWTVVSGTWDIVAGKAVATAAGVVTMGALGTANIHGRMDITTPAAGVTPAGILLRYVDADNYWYIKLTPGTAGTDLELVKREAGVEATVATADKDYTAATTYGVQFSASGQSIQVWVAGSLDINYATAAFQVTAETVGLRDQGNSNFQFDNVQIHAKSGAYSTLDIYSS